MAFLRWLGVALLLAAAFPGAAAAYTYGKIGRMRMVRGELPGATFLDARVEKKWTARDADTVYWVTFSFEEGGARREQRTNVEAAQYRKLAVGSTLRVALVPGDSEAYPVDGIWASEGNLAFDRVLQVGEIGVASIFVLAGIACVGASLFARRTRSLCDGCARGKERPRT